MMPIIYNRRFVFGGGRNWQRF